MLIDGYWLATDDGAVRPAITIRVQRENGQFILAGFLVDTGADKTVLAAALVTKLGLSPESSPPGLSLEGVGGKAGCAVVSTLLRFTSTDGQPINFQGQFVVFTGPSEEELCLLGRDVLDQFDVIVSRRRDQVLLVGGNHAYSVK